MATLLFDVDDFRAQFPGLFPDPPNTDALIEIFWDAAICYVSPDTEGALSADCRRQVLNLVTAHLITLSESAQAGNQPGFVVSASIDKISVTVQAPPNKTAFQFFLFQTPFIFFNESEYPVKSESAILLPKILYKDAVFSSADAELKLWHSLQA